MQFVEQYLQKHHLIHNPHKWLLALIATPIHLAEMHYKKKYHMQFAHARKLFIFDMLLIFSTLTIFGAGLFWRLYNPTITNLVYLSIQKEPTRILSGERLDFDIVYKNESSVTLVSPKLSLTLPTGYILEKTEPAENFDHFNNTFVFNNLAPKSEGIVHIFGRIYETPKLENNILASLSYQQAGQQNEEKRTSPYIVILRGSVLKSNFTLADKILAKSTTLLTIELKNEGDIEINDIILPFQLPNGVTLINQKIETGNFISNNWLINKLKPNETTRLEAFLNFNLDSKQPTLKLQFTPEIFINNKSIPQETWEKELKILHPNLEITSNWENNLKNLQPGKIANIYFNLKNTGDIELENINLLLSIPENIIDNKQFLTINNLNSKNNQIIFNSNKNLKPNESIQITLKIPIKNYPTGGTDITLSLNPQIEAKAKDLDNIYKINTQTPKINIGTSLFSTAEIRYYTVEGDQIGRGPLPPKVNEETKYWAIIQMTNGTSNISNLHLNTTLPSYVSWTGKSSVSIGNDISFNQNTRQISWNLKNLPANTSEGVYFELSIIPDASMLTTNPIILKNISITGQDSFINQDISKSFGNLDNSLKTDSIGRIKGSIVK
ncbi:MAG: hypothetical protein AUJ23_02600 [Candidatus Magasanikbacteria bacterium CG1_02_32_51]|uniref:DUF11 domain-containing protein n=1 Tax=Candidatus Magasanikbacteria bacterium CG1_02_32_51 TaxID=1805238 RepID=A0A1J4U9U7_9BACT|nr:MAG: hypothetical protein AUJ23_02600 [Candidatus Magasanikbacteria bacterium CG1_02_32_51]